MYACGKASLVTYTTSVSWFHIDGCSILKRARSEAMVAQPLIHAPETTAIVSPVTIGQDGFGWHLCVCGYV
jgi:hypothetical protein